MQVYERAVAQVPPALEKRYWQRYIYLWICYALFEELEAEDPARTREVYRTCLKLIPHDLFTFAKVGRTLLCGICDLEGRQSSLLEAQTSSQARKIEHCPFLQQEGQVGQAVWPEVCCCAQK